MTPDTLAAIVARDAADPAGPGELTWDRMFAVEDDRRALLALLRSVKGAVETVAQYDEWAAEWLAKHPALAALGTEPPA